MILTAAPLGKLVTGHVLDVSLKPLERELQKYDPQLYLKWNARKLKGNGIWELRRRSDTKGITNVVPFQGNTICVVDHYENNFVNHVKDFAYLNYQVLDWVKSHDLWEKGLQRGNVAAQAERNFDAYTAEQERKNREQMAYELKQHKGEWNWLKDYASKKGQSIADLADVWGKK